MKRQDAARARGERGQSGFTLVELLATVAILIILISLLVPAIRGAIGSARSFVCQRNLGTITFDFSIFADPVLHESRRGMDPRYSDDSFQLLTFMDNQYRTGEFWEGGPFVPVMPLNPDSPIMCPSAPERIDIRRVASCISGDIDRPQAVSIAFNRRLHRPDPVTPAVPVFTLRSRILDQATVPLLWDTDGAAAFRRVREESPLSAPSLGSRSELGNNRYWHPALRHNGKMNVGFIGGHVKSTSTPLTENGWRWEYQPRR